MKVEYDAIVEPPNMGFRIYPEHDLTSDQVALLDRVTMAWYDARSFGGFGGRLHFSSDLEWDDEDRAFEFWVDMGSAGEPAIEALVKILETFEQNADVVFEKLVIGFPPIERRGL